MRFFYGIKLLVASKLGELFSYENTMVLKEEHYVLLSFLCDWESPQTAKGLLFFDVKNVMTKNIQA